MARGSPLRQEVDETARAVGAVEGEQATTGFGDSGHAVLSGLGAAGAKPGPVEAEMAGEGLQAVSAAITEWARTCPTTSRYSANVER